MNSEMKSRTFSKRMVAANCISAWVIIALAAWRGSGEELITPAFGLIGFICAGYMGVGHLDYRSVLGAGRGGRDDQPER